MRTTAHPYMANSMPELKQELLEAVGAASIEELFAQIPESHRLRGELDLPPALASELELSRHLRETLARNASCEENLSFLGAGCWQHHVPAVCDEIVRRQRVRDPGLGDAVVGLRPQPGLVRVLQPARRAARARLRRPSRLQLGLRGRPRDPHGRADERTRRGARGRLARPRAPRRDPHLLRASRDPEPPRRDARRLRPGHRAARPRRPPGQGVRTHGGCLRREPLVPGDDRGARPPRSCGVAHEAGAEAIVGVDPISLGVLAPPGDYGADIAVGTVQPLGVHMSCGGGVGGFIASRDEERYAREYPTLNISICDTIVPGERGFGVALFHQTSYGLARGGERLDGQLDLPVGDRGGGVHVAPRAARLRGGGRADPPAKPLRGLAPRRDPRRARGVAGRVLQGVRRLVRRGRLGRLGGEPAASATGGSSVARISRGTIRRSARARSTA